MKNIIDKINEAVGARSDSDLARKLSKISGKEINRSIISRWRSDGFFGSTEALILLLLRDGRTKCS